MKPRFSACAIRKMGPSLTEVGEKGSNNSLGKNVKLNVRHGGFSLTVSIHGSHLWPCCQVLSLHAFSPSPLPGSQRPTVNCWTWTSKILVLYCVPMNNLVLPMWWKNWRKQVLGQIDYKKCQSFISSSLQGAETSEQGKPNCSLLREIFMEKEKNKRKKRGRKECKGGRRRPYKKENKEEDE